MEIVVALLEIIAMTIALAFAVCVLCVMGAIIYIVLSEQKSFDKEDEDD